MTVIPLQCLFSVSSMQTYPLVKEWFCSFLHTGLPQYGGGSYTWNNAALSHRVYWVLGLVCQDMVNDQRSHLLSLKFRTVLHFCPRVSKLPHCYWTASLMSICLFDWRIPTNFIIVSAGWHTANLKLNFKYLVEF